MRVILQTQYYCNKVALAEWLRRVPAKYMGFPRESSNLSGDDLLTFSPSYFSPHVSCSAFIFPTSLCTQSFLSSCFKQILIYASRFPPFSSRCRQGPQNKIKKRLLNISKSKGGRVVRKVSVYCP